jgi:tetratricopeptide (TPR) repeat protein
MIKRFLLCLALAACVAQQVCAKTKNPGVPFTMGPEIDSAWLAGLNYMYQLQYDKAAEQFKNLTLTHPDQPAGDLAMTGLTWWKYSQDYDIPKNQAQETAKEFEQYANAAIDKSKEYLKTHPDDAGTYFIMGTSYGILGRWYALERHWWKAYTHGSKARKYLNKALELNPQLYDADAGLGIFDYYTDTLPGVIKISALLFIHGNKKRGLEELDLAAQNGKFFRTEAKLFKMAILIQFEHDTRMALQMAQDLRASDPDNVFFRFTEFVTRFNANDWDGTLDEGTKFMADLKASIAAAQNPVQPSPAPLMATTTDALSATAQPPIPAESLPGINRQQALIYLALGDAYVMKGDYLKALDMFTEGINTPFPEKGWITYCYIRRGQTYELLGQRDKALPDYKKAAEREDFWDTMDDAKRGLKKPYTRAEILQQIESH